MFCGGCQTEGQKKKNGATPETGMLLFCTRRKKKRLERRLDKLSVTVWVDLFSSPLITPDWTKLIRIRVMPFGCIYNKSDKVIKTWQVLHSGVCVCVRSRDLTNTTGQCLQLHPASSSSSHSPRGKTPRVAPSAASLPIFGRVGVVSK